VRYFEVWTEALIPSVARPALEKFMLSLPKYAVFARTSAMLSIKVEADEAKKCLSQTKLEGVVPAR
jgi:hypothetical protein